MTEASSLGALASRFIETESLPWVETAPGNKMKVIYHDATTGMLTILAKLEPGRRHSAARARGSGADIRARRLAAR